jgi:hypothetical protein
MWIAAALALFVFQSPAVEHERAIELAGVGFRAGNYAEAQRYIRKALRSQPDDAYSNDFLATLYLLQDNTEAALKYWNRIGAPRIENVRTGPDVPLNPILWDRSFAFSPGSTLSLTDFENTKARMESLDVFSRLRFELLPAGDNFDIVVHPLTRGWSAGGWPGMALSLGRGLPYQTVQYDLANVRSTGTNLSMLVRWDSQKRRVSFGMSGPIKRNPERRFEISMDARDEVWAIEDSQFPIKKLKVSASVKSQVNARWSWTSGIHASTRRSGKAEDRNGVLLTYEAQLRHRVFSLPERRLSMTSFVGFEFGKQFNRTTLNAAVQWLPLSKGDDYKTTISFHAGKAAGAVPFDEYFALGIDRDNEYVLRGHPGVHDGQKGAGPIGRKFVSVNVDVQKNFFDYGFIKAGAGPFLDAARLTRTSPALVDAGVQVRLSVVGAVSFDLSFGRDLRNGHNAVFYRSR